MRADKKQLKLAMAKACMNTADIAKAAKIPYATVNNVVCGRSVTPKTIGIFAKAIGADVASIIAADTQ